VSLHSSSFTSRYFAAD